MKARPKSLRVTYRKNNQAEKLGSQDIVVNEQKILRPSSQEMEGSDSESKTNLMLMNENWRLKRQVTVLENTVEQLNQQIAENMEKHKCVEMSQKNEYESAMTHLKELHEKEIISLRQQTYELPTLQVNELL